MVPGNQQAGAVPRPLKQKENQNMAIDEVFRKLACATPDQVSQVSRILDGSAIGAAEPNLKTLTIKEAAERLGVSRPTMYRVVRDREVESVRICGTDRVRLESLIAYATRPSSRLASRASSVRY